MSLKDHIETRVNELTTNNPDCTQKRVTLCLWDKSIGEFEKMVQYSAKEFDLCEFTDYTELENEIDRQAARYNGLKDERRLLCPNGIYVLVVVAKMPEDESQRVFEQGRDSFRQIFARFACEFLVVSDPAEPENNRMSRWNNYTVWYAKNDFSAIDILIGNARYNESLLSEKVKKYFRESSNFILKTDECNSIREDLCYKYLREIEKEICSGNEGEINREIEDYLFPVGYKREIISEIPKLEWLPLMGIEQLKNQLPKDNHRIWNKIKSWFGKNEEQESMLLEDAIDILYNSRGAMIRTESIRDSLVKEGIIRSRCQSYLDTMKENISKEIKERFSVYDMLYTLQRLLSERKDKIQEELREIDRTIKKMLEEPFDCSESTVRGVYIALEPYRKKFEEFCEKYTEFYWGEVLSRYCDEFHDSAKIALCEFRDAETVLKNSLIPQASENTPYEMSFYKKSTGLMRLACMKDLKNRIDQYVGNCEFSHEDIIAVMRGMDRFFEKQKSLHVDKHKHPIVFMLVASDAEINDDEVEQLVQDKELELSWKLLKEDHLSKKRTYQLRIYNID